MYNVRPRVDNDVTYYTTEYTRLDFYLLLKDISSVN